MGRGSACPPGSPVQALPPPRGSHRSTDHGPSVSQGGVPRRREVPETTNQLLFIKCISFISHFFAASLVASQVSVDFRRHRVQDNLFY